MAALSSLRLCAVARTLLFLTAATASAQEQDTTYLLPDVRVSATPIYSAASDMQLRAADFALQPKSSAQDLLRIVPGLVIAQHAGGGKAEQIFLRGFDADHGTDVNISVDDAPVNMVSHGHGQGYADLHFIIPEIVERIDVLKGPYFARYGDFMTAGAVAMTTVDSVESSRIRLEGGSFGTYRALGIVGGSLADGLNGYFAGELSGSDGYFEQQQNFNRANLFAKIVAGVGTAGRAEASVASFSAGWDASGQVPQRAIDRGLITRFGSLDPTEGGATSRTTATVSYTSGGDAPLSITGSFTDYRFRLYSNFTFFAGDSVRGDGIEQTDDRTVMSLRAEKPMLYSALGIPMITRIGTTLRSDDIDVALHHDSARVRLETTADAGIRQRHIAPYVEQEILLPWASIQLGLRADYASFDVENRVTGRAAPDGVADHLLLSPKANIAVPITSELALFANSGFGFHSNDARVAVMRPETSSLARAFGAELGARYATDDRRFAVAAAAWQLDLESELVYVGDEGTTEESGRTRRRGLDLEMHATPVDWLAFGANATYSHGRFRDEPEGENFIPLAPTLTLSATARATVDDLAILGRVRAVDDRPANESGSVTALGYAIADLSASYTLGPVELSVTVENLFDAVWNEAQFDTESRLQGESETVSELHFTPGAPRAVRFGCGVAF